jgi:hypothetical protein
MQLEEAEPLVSHSWLEARNEGMSEILSSKVIKEGY